MHTLLERYLSDVAAHLGPLPARRCADELREMRVHLEAAFAAGLVRGQSEDEAARGVLRQFGTPDVVGAETVAAWRRGRGLDRRSFWGAAAAGFVLLTVLLRLMLSLQLAYFRQFAPKQPPVWAMNFAMSWGPLDCLLFGGIVGVLFPRRAISAVALAWGADIVWSIVFQAYHATHAGRAVGFPLSFILQEIVWCAVGVLLSLLAAWAGSRWRTRRGRGGVRVARG